MKRFAIAGALLFCLTATVEADSFIRFNIGARRGAHRWRPTAGISFGYDSGPRVRRVVRRGGHWILRTERVWVPGYHEQVWVPARYETVYVRGHFDRHGNWVSDHTERRLVENGHYERIWHPGYHKNVRRRVRVRW